MSWLKSIALTALAFASTCVAVAQVGVGGGGGSGGGWNITYAYSGSCTLNTPTGSTTIPWFKGPIGVGGFGPLDSASTSGTITATLTWVGKGNAPATVNVDVSASAVAGNSGPSVSNGYNDPITETDDIYGGVALTQKGVHLKTLGVSGGTATVAVSLSASSGAITDPEMLSVVGVGMSVAIDPRFAYIQVAGHPVNYAKSFNGNTVAGPVFTLSDGSTRTYSYAQAVPVVNPQITGSNLLTSGGTFHLGLPLQTQQIGMGANGQIVAIPAIVDDPVSFEANVYQLLIPTETYVWNSDQGGFSSDLPTYLSGWDIKNLNNTYTPPSLSSWITTTPSTVTTSNGAVGSNSFVNFTYTWNDGVVATCVDTIDFHVSCEYQSQLLQYLDFDPSVGWSPVPWSPAPQGGWIPGNAATYPAMTADRDWTLYDLEIVLTLALGGLSALDPPVGIFWSVAAAGAGVAIAYNPPAPTTIAISNGGQTGFDDADANQRVTPANWRDTDPTATLNDFNWTADYRPKVLYTYNLEDNWTLDGYNGQSVSLSKVPQTLGNATLEWFYQLAIPGK